MSNININDPKPCISFFFKGGKRGIKSFEKLIAQSFEKNCFDAKLKKIANQNKSTAKSLHNFAKKLVMTFLLIISIVILAKLTF